MTDPEDPVICLCSQVPESTIRQALHAGCRTLDELRGRTGANTGCGDCLMDLEEIGLDVLGSELE